MLPRILRYISVCLSFAVAVPVMAQQDSVKVETVSRIRGVQYSSPDEAALALRNKKQPLFAGFSVSGNLAGAILSSVTSYGEIEGAVRANLKNTYFPVCELGVGVCDKKDDATTLRYETRSPFFRVGCDYNFLNDKSSGNRVFGGLRIGFTSFKYDISGADLKDPVWNENMPYDFNDIKGKQAWIELVFGLEAKIWRIFHLGWSARYKSRMSHSSGSIGAPWYVPGYGKNGTTVIGGTFHVIFDI